MSYVLPVDGSRFGGVMFMSGEVVGATALHFGGNEREDAQAAAPQLRLV